MPGILGDGTQVPARNEERMRGAFPLTIKRCLASSRDQFSATCHETLDVK